MCDGTSPQLRNNRISGGHAVPRSLLSLQTAALAVSAILVTPTLQHASADETDPTRRTLDVEVLIQSQPSYRIKSQEWGRVFQELGYSVRFREPRGAEAPRVEDLDREDFPATRVIAAMAVNGSIQIGNQQFNIDNLQPRARRRAVRHGD
jgi:hypothetical protein